MRDGNRAANRGAELVATELTGLQATRILEEIGGVQLIVPQEFPHVAVKLVTSRLDGCIKNASACPAKLRAEGAGLYLEFLNSIHGRQHGVRCTGPKIRL